MSPELEQLKAAIADHKSQIQILSEQLENLIRACPHEVVQVGEGAECGACNKDFGWYCADSPDKVCHYESTDGADDRRYVFLINGGLHKLPASHKQENESDDWCIFCGAPDERK